MCRFAQNIAPKHLATGLCPDHLGELTALPSPFGGLRGNGWRGAEGRGKGREGEEEGMRKEDTFSG